MSLSAALSIALSGLRVTTTQLQLTANNISNAQQEGYTQKRAIVSPVQLGADTGGAAISGYTRSTDAALSTSYNDAISYASYLGTQNDYLKDVQTLLNSNTDNPVLSDAVAKFQAAWTEFSAAPESVSHQATVIQAGSNLASQIRTLAAGITNLTRQVVSETSSTVTTLNATLQRVGSLNAQIQAANGAGQPTGNLEDLRDQAIQEIASFVKVTLFTRENGQVAVYTPGGLLLVDGPAAQTFSYSGGTVTSSSGADVTEDLSGGKLQAQLEFAEDNSPTVVSVAPGSEVIRKINSQLEALAVALTSTAAGSPTTFANAYNNATTGTGELAASFFTINGTNDPSSLRLNEDLLDGSATVKVASANDVVAALNAARSFTADGLSVPSGTYADLTTALLANFQQAANTVNALSDPSQQQKEFFRQSLANATGVNVDNELVLLTTLQNSYSASAHVISVVNQMLADLEGIF